MGDGMRTPPGRQRARRQQREATATLPKKNLSLPLLTINACTSPSSVCEWCGIDFIRPHLRGRRPLFCKRTCRQRAYEERRRGALALGLPKATYCELLHPEPKLYQAGMGGEY
jgi:hypothetical protein